MTYTCRSVDALFVSPSSSASNLRHASAALGGALHTDVGQSLGRVLGGPATSNAEPPPLNGSDGLRQLAVWVDLESCTSVTLMVYVGADMETGPAILVACLMRWRTHSLVALLSFTPHPVTFIFHDDAACATAASTATIGRQGRCDSTYIAKVRACQGRWRRGHGSQCAGVARSLCPQLLNRVQAHKTLCNSLGNVIVGQPGNHEWVCIEQAPGLVSGRLSTHVRRWCHRQPTN